MNYTTTQRVLEDMEMHGWQHLIVWLDEEYERDEFYFIVGIDPFGYERTVCTEALWQAWKNRNN